MDSLEEQLSESRYLEGDSYSDADKKAFTDILEGRAPNVTTHPNTFAWYAMVRGYSWAKDIVQKQASETKKPAQKQETAK